MPEPADYIDLVGHVDTPLSNILVAAKTEAAPIQPAESAYTGQVSVPNVILRFLTYDTAPYPQSF